MRKVRQVIPEAQKEVFAEALSIMEAALKTVKNGDENLNRKLFDILTLKALLNKTELVVILPLDVYENFTANNGVDFPEYI